MTHFEEVQRDAARLDDLLREKSVTNASVTIAFNAGGSYISASYRLTPMSDMTYVGEYEDYLTNVDKIEEHIRNIPSQVDRERAEFYRLVATAARFGKSIGADDSLINPLEAMAKKLSSNIITYTASKTAAAINDEIPF